MLALNIIKDNHVLKFLFMNFICMKNVLGSRDSKLSSTFENKKIMGI